VITTRDASSVRPHVLRLVITLYRDASESRASTRATTTLLLHTKGLGKPQSLYCDCNYFTREYTVYLFVYNLIPKVIRLGTNVKAKAEGRKDAVVVHKNGLFTTNSAR